MSSYRNSTGKADQENGRRRFWRKGLSRTMLVWFLILSLVPLTLVSILSYRNAKESLQQFSLEALTETTRSTTAQLEGYFDRMLLDLKQESEAQVNVRFLEALIRYRNQSSVSVSEFVKSFQWAQTVDEHGADLRTFSLTYEYKDVLLIDNKGNVLFTVAGKDDLGTNLFSGPLSDTRLSRAARMALDGGRPVFSDFERYAPMNGEISGFLASVLVDEDGEKIGLFILNIDSRHVDNIMQKKAGLENMGRAYLIGEDLLLRSRWGVLEAEAVLETKIDTKQSQLWKHEHSETDAKEHEIEHGAFIYRGPEGREVLGVHRDIQFATISWAVVAEADTAEAFAAAESLKEVMLVLWMVTGLLVVFISIPLMRRMFQPLHALSLATRRIAAGDLEQNLTVRSKNEIGDLADNFNQMVDSLKAATGKAELENWFKNGRAELNDRMRGETQIAKLSKNIIRFLCKYLGAQVGAVYALSEEEIFQLTGSYAFRKRKGFSNVIEIGESLVGQAALEQEMIQVSQLPPDYMTVASGLGETPPCAVVVLPLVYEGRTEGIAELGFLEEPDTRTLEFFEQMAEPLALAFRVARSRKEMEMLLKQTQEQAEELRVREEELKDNNTLLEKQARELQVSEKRLMKQQASLEEQNLALESQQKELAEANQRLQTTAAELEQQTATLEIQKTETEEKNIELEKTQANLERKARELETTSKYKSEFLANMSHELRTPLNSLLILSRLLSNNEDGNLKPKQVEFAQTIYDSGNDLLNLINDILDLSKIEAGRLAVESGSFKFSVFLENVHKKFDSLADKKGLAFTTRMDSNSTDRIVTDTQKVQQIIHNLLSNAFKFTGSGSVTLSVGPVAPGVHFFRGNLSPDRAICFEVTDTGIGIEAEKHRLVFEAFQQADGSTSRKYGGTGLGLSISRELAGLLGGEIHLHSEKGKGSRFSLYLPVEIASTTLTPDGKRVLPDTLKAVTEDLVAKDTTPRPSVPECASAPVLEIESIRDDRRQIESGDRSVLIIEDDPKFARLMMDLARERGFKCLIAGDGETGLHFAEFHVPSGIILDIGLPGIDGWEVMERLKENMKTRHIPVHFISAADREIDAMIRGAVGYMTKPVDLEDIHHALGRIENIIDKPKRDLLVVEDDAIQADSIKELIGNGDVRTTIAASGSEALALLGERRFDCIVLDLGLPDMDGQIFLEHLRAIDATEHIPVVVYTGKDVSDEQREVLSSHADSILVKGARSPEQLLDETALFLHRIEADLPEDKRRMIRMLHDHEAVFEGKSVLLVDDDMRNVYALSQILREKGINVLAAKDGKQGVAKLHETPRVDLVLMDIMMPEMDGYEAMREIRENHEYRDLPIIALTAKAMKGDRARCMAAGASDYLAKPVDPSKLLSMLRVWMYR